MITSTIGYSKYLLRSEQKKNDFLSDELASQATAACRHVVEYLHRVITQMKNNLDGENIDIVLGQFGSRLYNLIFEHLQGKYVVVLIPTFNFYTPTVNIRASHLSGPCSNLQSCQRERNS